MSKFARFAVVGFSKGAALGLFTMAVYCAGYADVAKTFSSNMIFERRRRANIKLT